MYLRTYTYKSLDEPSELSEFCNSFSAPPTAPTQKFNTDMMSIAVGVPKAK
jgi:hypothetical protein